MTKFKKDMLLAIAFCIISAPCMAQSGTILDVEEELHDATQNNRAISPDMIRDIIKEKVAYRQYDTIFGVECAVIESTLREYRDLLVAEDKSCVSDKKLHRLKEITNCLMVFGANFGGYGVGYAFGYPTGILIRILIDMLLKRSDVGTSYDFNDLAPVAKACLLMTISGAGIYKASHTLYKKIEQKQEQRRNRALNIQVIDNLLAYLNYEKSAAAGAGQALSC
ncbi:MAG: hypothetical protein WC707_01045 [Candidatus Babeliaceae bacterium]|jgi:hypothetical protein